MENENSNVDYSLQSVFQSKKIDKELQSLKTNIEKLRDAKLQLDNSVKKLRSSLQLLDVERKKLEEKAQEARKISSELESTLNILNERMKDI